MADDFQNLKSEIDNWLSSIADESMDTLVETCTCCRNFSCATTLTISAQGNDKAPCISLKPDEVLFLVSVITESDEYFVGSGGFQDGEQTLVSVDSSNCLVPLVDLIAAVAKGSVWETTTYWKEKLAVSSIEIHAGALTVRATNNSFVLKPLASIFPGFKRESRKKLPGYRSG